jgi:hypothetical protein
MAAPRQLSTWQLFVRDMIPQIKADPPLKANERFDVIVNLWKNLSQQQKQDWKIEANQIQGRENQRLILPRKQEVIHVAHRPMEGIVADLAGLQEAQPQQVERAEGEPQNPKLPASKECVVCMDSARSVIFLPCKHLACCANCAKILPKKECPICKKAIESLLDLSDVHVC